MEHLATYFDDLGLPIEKTVIAGPAVDRLRERKEAGSLEPEPSKEELLSNWEQVRPSIVHLFRDLLGRKLSR